MKLYMTGLEKGDLLIQVTAWVGFIVYCLTDNKYDRTGR
jgi:hypothetical protein